MEFEVNLSIRTLALTAALLLGPALAVAAQTIPDGTNLAVQLDSTVSSRTARVGDVVPASLAQELIVDGRTLARRGAPLRARVTYAKRSGRFHNPGYITIRLSSIDIDGHQYELNSTAVRDKGESHTRSNLTKIGGGAGIGAVIGALAGGGSGALLGGLIGAGAGTGVAAATGRRPAELQAESIYNFTLTSAARR